MPEWTSHNVVQVQFYSSPHNIAVQFHVTTITAAVIIINDP